jgi:hypothetical protein
MAIDNNVDFVSDLNGTGDTTVSVNESNVPATGADALELNNQRPAQAQKIKEPAAPAGEKPASLRDQISSAIKGDTETPPAASKDGRTRNPDGTFAPAAAAPADPNAAPAADTVIPPVDPAAPAAPVVAAPQGIDPQVFQSLPAETQAVLARTMEDLNTRQQRVAGMEQLDQMLAPRREAWALQGMGEAQALNLLFSLSDFAGRDPGAFIQYIAEQNGVDLEALVIGQEPVDPKYSALEQQVQQLQTERQQEAQQRQQAAHEQTVQSVAAFATEKGPDGQPLRPYFAELGAEVLPFISAVKAQNPNMPQNEVLQNAYERACWGSPTVRAKMQAAANAEAEAERLRTGVDKAARARNASVSVAPGAPTSAPTPPNDSSRSLRDTIRASMAAAE